MSEWLLEITGWITQFCPKITIVLVTHRAVKFKRGKNIKLVEPGIMWHWPLVTHVCVQPVVRQPMDLPVQRLTTADDKRVMASASMAYEISDLVVALTHNWDYDSTIREVSMAVVGSIINNYDYLEIVEFMASGELEKELSESCREELKQYGILLDRCFLTDFCRTSVIALSNSGDPAASLVSDD